MKSEEVNSNLSGLIKVTSHQAEITVGGNSANFGQFNWEISGYKIMSITLVCGSSYVLCELTSPTTGGFKVRNFDSQERTLVVRAILTLIKK